MDAELMLYRRQTALEGAHDTGCDAGRVPVHPHDGAKRLEPERIGEAAQELIATVVVYHGLRDHTAQPCHARRQPVRDLPAMQRQVRTAGALRHEAELRSTHCGGASSAAPAGAKSVCRTFVPSM